MIWILRILLERWAKTYVQEYQKLFWRKSVVHDMRDGRTIIEAIILKG